VKAPFKDLKKQKKFYSGKKKRHTLKSQVVVDKASKKVICTNFCNGKHHDLKLLETSRVRCKPDTKLILDSGYQGVVA
jgi:hypothetical protein